MKVVIRIVWFFACAGVGFGLAAGVVSSTDSTNSALGASSLAAGPTMLPLPPEQSTREQTTREQPAIAAIDLTATHSSGKHDSQTLLVAAVGPKLFAADSDASAEDPAPATSDQPANPRGPDALPISDRVVPLPPTKARSVATRAQKAEAVSTADRVAVNAPSHLAGPATLVSERRQIEFAVTVYKAIPLDADAAGIDFETVRTKITQFDPNGTATLSAFHSDPSGAKLGFYKGREKVLFDTMRTAVNLQSLARSKFELDDGQMATIELNKRKDKAATSDDDAPTTELSLLPTIADGDLLRIDIRPQLGQPATTAGAGAVESAWIKTMVRDDSTIVMSFTRHHRLTTVNQIAMNLSPRWRGQLLRGERGVVQPEEWVVFIRPKIMVAALPSHMQESSVDSNVLPEPPSEPARAAVQTQRRTKTHPVAPAEVENESDPTASDESTDLRHDTHLARASYSGAKAETEPAPTAKATPASRANAHKIPGKTQDLLDQGAIALEAGDLARASATLKLAVALSPENLEVPLAVATIALQQKHPGVAWEILLPALDRNPSSVVLLQALAITYFELGKPATAEQTLNKAIKIDKSNALSYKLMGQILSKRGEKERSASYLQVADRLEMTRKATR